MTDRKFVDVECDDIQTDYYDLFNNKTPDEIIELMNEFKDNYPNRDLYFRFVRYGYDGGVELFVNERRKENDKEYKDRMEQDEKSSNKLKAKEAKELAEYKRLKAKYQDIENEKAIEKLAEDQGWVKNVTSLIPVSYGERITVKKKDGSFSNIRACDCNWSNESSPDYVTHYRKSQQD